MPRAKVSKRVPCPSPERCKGVRWHEIGSGGHAACMAGAATPLAGAPAPAAPGAEDQDLAGRHAVMTIGPCYSDRKKVARLLNDAFRAADAEVGWSSGAGTPHPTGGYTERSISLSELSRVVVVCRSAAGWPHRDDGPATVSYDDDGDVVEVKYARHGRAHRDDGPAEETRGKPPSFILEGISFYAPEGARGSSVRWKTAARFETLAAATGQGREAMKWLWLQGGGLDHDLIDTMVAAGGDADLVRQALDAGVEDHEALAQVAAGTLPISWAGAGLESSS